MNDEQFLSEDLLDEDDGNPRIKPVFSDVEEEDEVGDEDSELDDDEDEDELGEGDLTSLHGSEFGDEDEERF